MSATRGVLTGTSGARFVPWLMTCLGACLFCTFAFACASPLAGLAALVALNLPRRQALGVAAAVWLANQAVGFLFLHYPHDASTFGWGAALGVATVLACAAALACLRIDRPVVRFAVAFLAAFATYEIALFAVTPVLGGTGAFTMAIVARIFLINASAFLLVAALHALFGAVHRRDRLLAL